MGLCDSWKLKIGEKIKINKAIPLYDINGLQKGLIEGVTEVTIFEIKNINNQIYYRIGNEEQWILKSDINTKNIIPIINSAPINNSSVNKTTDKITPQYDLSVKKGLTIVQGSSIPTGKSLTKIFKNADKFPDGTKYEWIYQPDTSQNKYTNARIKVIFPNGFEGEHNVHYIIQKVAQNDNISQSQERIKPRINNKSPKELDFSFVENNELIGSFKKNVDEALSLYSQTFYKQMSNTIRQALESITDKLLLLNKINPGPEWDKAILSNQLGYIAHLRLLPQRIMNLCFSIKSYGNIGSHHNKVTEFNQVSALTDLQQYHDVLVYLINTYQNKDIPYADIQITYEKNKHKAWYRKPQIDFDSIISFSDYISHKNTSISKSIQHEEHFETFKPVPIRSQQIELPKKYGSVGKMGKRMKILTWIFGIVIAIILMGTGYEWMQMISNKYQPDYSEKITVRQQARDLNTKQIVAMSLVYANMKLDGQWQSAYAQMKNDGYKVYRYKNYNFEKDVTVTADEKNYVYVLEKDVGFGFQDKSNGDRLVTFFDPDQNDPKDNPVHVYTYQMLQQLKEHNNLSEAQQIYEKLSFTDEEIN